MAVVPFQYRHEHGTAGGAGECVEDQKILPVGVHHILPARILIPVVERVLVEQLPWVFALACQWDGFRWVRRSSGR